MRVPTRTACGKQQYRFPYATATSDASNPPVLTREATVLIQKNRRVQAYMPSWITVFLTGQKFQWYNAFMDFKTYQVRDERKQTFGGIRSRQ